MIKEKCKYCAGKGEVRACKENYFKLKEKGLIS